MGKTWACWRDASHTVREHPIFGWPQCADCAAAPHYWERREYLPKDLVLTVYVPTGQTRILPGSGVVGVPLDARMVSVSYEGWKYGTGTWEDAVRHAADRLVTGYPTIAKAMLHDGDLRAVGTYHPTTDVLDVTDEAALRAWQELEKQ